MAQAAPITLIKSLTTELQGIGSQLLDYAIFAATVGTIVMALLELLKAITHARRRFHEYEMRRWIEQKRSGSIGSALRFGSDTAAGSPRWEEFLALVTGGYASRRAVFDQPIEKLMAQVQAAANMALDFPDRYPQLYEFLTTAPKRKEGAPGASSAPETGSATEPSPSDAELWRKAAAARTNASAPPPTDNAPPPSSTPDSSVPPSSLQRRGAEARARLQNLVARQLDALQTEIFYRWARSNQTVATVAGTVLTLMVLLPMSAKPGTPNVVLAVALAFVSGLTAPFAKDVVSGLSGFARSSKG
jgi:hypothetical protein